MRVIYPADTKKEVPQVVTEVVQEDGTLAPVRGNAGQPATFSIEFTPVFSTGVCMSDEDSARLSMLF